MDKTSSSVDKKVVEVLVLRPLLEKSEAVQGTRVVWKLDQQGTMQVFQPRVANQEKM